MSQLILNVARIATEKIMTKISYETPAVEALGSFEQLTQAAVTGSRLDSTEPAGTPVSELTFS